MPEKDEAEEAAIDAAVDERIEEAVVEEAAEDGQDIVAFTSGVALGQCGACGAPIASDASHCMYCRAPNSQVKQKDLSLDDQIIQLLTLRQRDQLEWLEFGEIAEITKMTKNKPNLNYHLKKLVDLEVITKKVVTGKNPLYGRDKDSPTVLEAKILEVLSSENYKPHNFDELHYAICSTTESQKKEGIYPEFVEKDLRGSLQKLLIENKIEHTGDVDYSEYSIPFWYLPNSVCAYCRKEFEDDGLVISQFMIGPDTALLPFPIHATCRSKLRHPSQPHFETDVCCDYCGLNLNARFIGVNLVSFPDNKDTPEQVNNLVQSALETLYDEPYSKIFSYIDSKDDFIDRQSQEGGYFGENFDSAGYAHYVRKNGKQFHPYCAKQVK